MSSKYTTLLYDADMTLLDFNSTMSIGIKELFEHLGIEYSKEKEDLYESINTSFWKKLELGECDRPEVKYGRFREFFKAVGYDKTSPEDAHKFYENAISLHGILLKGAKEHLEKVFDKFTLYMITNGTKIVQDRRIDSTDIRQYFKEIFISEDTGFEKPSKEYFDIVLKAIPEKDRARMIIIGDSLSSDIKGGVNTGIDTIWYNPFGKTNNTDIIPTYMVSSYEEIERILFQE